MHWKVVKHNSKELVIKEIDDYGLYSSYLLKWNGNCNMKLFCCMHKSCKVKYKVKISNICGRDDRMVGLRLGKRFE